MRLPSNKCRQITFFFLGDGCTKPGGVSDPETPAADPSPTLHQLANTGSAEAGADRQWMAAGVLAAAGGEGDHTQKHHGWLGLGGCQLLGSGATGTSPVACSQGAPALFGGRGGGMDQVSGQTRGVPSGMGG